MDNHLIISGMCSVTILTVRLFRWYINETGMGSNLGMSTELFAGGWIGSNFKIDVDHNKRKV